MQSHPLLTVAYPHLMLLTIDAVPTDFQQILVFYSLLEEVFLHDEVFRALPPGAFINSDGHFDVFVTVEELEAVDSPFHV